MACRGEKGFWWRNLKEQDRLLYKCSLEDIIKMYVKDIK